jgi:hypothetical protein
MTKAEEPWVRDQKKRRERRRGMVRRRARR